MAESRVAVYGAIAANVAIAVTKFTVAALTGSAAMLSEAIHSTVDAGNGLLLLVGMKLSERPPSAQHPFGHGRELYFWSLIVAVLIFGLGGGVSMYEGILHIRDPEPLADPTWNYVVLAAAALFEGASFLVALRAFRAASNGMPMIQALRQSKDPTTYTVLAEDFAALIGLALAGTGIYLSHRIGVAEIDGAASVLIGVLLAGVAVLLIHEARGLLVGEGVSAQTARGIRDIVLTEQGVREVGPVLSMYIGAEEVLLTLDLRFDAGIDAHNIARATRSIEARIRTAYPRIRRIYLEPHLSS